MNPTQSRVLYQLHPCVAVLSRDSHPCQGLAIVFTLWHIIGMWLARRAIFRLIAILRETTKVRHGRSSRPPLHSASTALSLLALRARLSHLAARLTSKRLPCVQVYKQMTLILLWPIFSIIWEAIVFISGMLMFYFMVSD